MGPALARKLSLLLISATLLLTPVIVVPGVATSAPSIHSKELAVRALLAILAFSLILASRALDRRCLRLTEWAVLSFVATQVLSAAFSGRFLYCLFETWHLWMLPGLAVAVPRLLPSRSELGAAALTIATAALLAAAYGYAAYFDINPLAALYPFALGTEGRNTMHSFLGNPEYFGTYLAPCAALSLSMALRRGARVWVAALWTSAALAFLAAVALSGTRGAFLAFALAAAVAAWTQGRRLAPRARRRSAAVLAAAVAAGFAALAILSVPNPLNPRNLQLAQRFALMFDLRSESVRERILFFSLAGRMAADNPVLGSGPGTYKLEFFPALDRMVLADSRAGVLRMAESLHSGLAEHAHNDYLEVWAETGTVGFAALLLILIAAGWEFARRVPPPAGNETDEHLVTLRTGFFVAALCLFASAAFSFPLHLPARASLAWAALGFFLAADDLLRRGAPSGLPGTPIS